MERLAAITRDRTLGELRRVAVENYAQDDGLPPEHWFWDKKVSGGILVEHGVHFIDMVHALSDQRPVKICGASHCRREGMEDQVTATVVYDRGLVATHYHAFARPGYFEATSVRFVFDLGQFDLAGWIPLDGTFNALVSAETRRRLEAIPEVHLSAVMDVMKMKDISRLEGWGESEIPLPDSSPTRVCSGGIEYEVSEAVKGVINTGKSKQDVYEESVCRVLADLIAKIEDPTHEQRTPLSTGLESLRIACEAGSL